MGFRICRIIGCEFARDHDGPHGKVGDVMSIDERVEQSKAKLEEWSAQEVRTTLDDYRKAQGGIDILRGSAVTLEGLAAVIGAIGTASVQANHMLDPKDRHAISGDLVRLVRKARELACGNPEAPPPPCSSPECTRYAHGEDLSHIPGPHRVTEAAVAKAEALPYAKRSAGHFDLRSQSEAKRLQNLTQGSTIRIWPHENPDRVLLMDCRPDSPWKGKTLFEPVTALVQEASYALSGGYLAALYDSRAKEAK